MTDLITQVAKLISVGRSGGVPDRETAGRIVEMIDGRSGADAPSGFRPTDGAFVSTADAASIPNAEWIILPDQNLAIHFTRHKVWIDFRVFDAADVTDAGGDSRWELFDGGDSWPLDAWETAFWQLDGSIKWDGCINWQNNPECMMHGCGPSHVSWVTDAFSVIYAYAKRHFDLLGDEAPAMPAPFIEVAAASGMEARQGRDAEERLDAEGTTARPDAQP